MNPKNNPSNLSYYRLLLMDFLHESHPKLIRDEKFIAARTGATLDAYEQAVHSGSNPLEAAHFANEVLFNGLHFSKHDTLKQILWNEFSTEIPEDEAAEWAIRLLSHCEAVFSNYPLSDDFAYSSEYDLLYTELTGTIAILLENQE